MMTLAIGSAGSALSDLGIQTLPSGSRGIAEYRRTMTPELRPLEFTLRFASGDRLVICLVGSGNEPTAFWHVIHAFQRLTALQSGWDSYGALPLQAAAVRRSLSLLPSLLPNDAPEPTVIPTRDGGVQFEWHRHGIDIEVKVPPTGPIAYLVADAPHDVEHEQEGTIDRQVILSAFAQMARVA